MTKLKAMLGIWLSTTREHRPVPEGGIFELDESDPREKEMIQDLFSSESCVPADYPEKVECVGVADDFVFHHAKHGPFTVRKDEEITLPAVVAYRLIKVRAVRPKDKNLWSPDRVLTSAPTKLY